MILRITIFCLAYFLALLINDSQAIAIEVKSSNTSELIKHTSKILCAFKTKTINVYFENKTSSSTSSFVLQHLSDCGTSVVLLRNRNRKSKSSAIKDDGILMYLLIVLRNATRPIEFSIIAKQSAAKHLSHVIIAVEESQTVTETWIRNTFKRFWKIWFSNVVIFCWRNAQLEVYGFNPFAENFLLKVDFAGDVPEKEELFPKRLPNMHLKPLRICLYPDGLRAIFHPDGSIEGGDGLMTRFVAQRLNATRIVNRISIRGYENRTSEICLKEIVTGVNDMALNIRFLTLSTFYKKVEPTIVHSRDDLCVLVPKAKTAPIFWNLFRSYSILVWCLIFISLLLAYGFCLAFYRSVSLRPGFLLQLFGSVITLPFTQPPLIFSLRLFLFCWFFYGMLICGAFKGTLTSNLVFSTYLPDINTLQDLALSPYKLLVYPRHSKILETFLDDNNHYEAIIRKKVTITPDTQVDDYIKVNNRSFAYVRKLQLARFEASSKSHIRLGRPVYHVMETGIVPFHAVYIVPYGSPYLGYLNFLIRSSQEFGIFDRWNALMQAHYYEPRKTFVKSERANDNPVNLKLFHFQAAFVFWHVGLFIAFLIFLAEKWGKHILMLSKNALMKRTKET